MIKKILFIQIFSLLLSSCSSFPLTEHDSTNINSVKLSREENEIIKLSKILTKIDSNWIQEKKYENDRLAATFQINLERDGSIKNLKLYNSFCVDDFNNECENFVINTKKTTVKSFPMEELKSINYSNWEYLTLSFGSKEGNELFYKQQKKN